MTEKKVKKIIGNMKKEPNRLRPDEIRYIIEIAAEHPRWGVKRIFDEALRPRMRSCLVLSLTPKMKESLKKAAEKYQIGMSDVCYHILEEWFEAKKI